MVPAPQTTPVALTDGTRRPHFIPLVRGAALLVVGAFAVLLVVRQWDEILAALSRLRLELVIASGGLVLVSLMASAASWRALLAGLDSRLPVLAAGRVFFLGQLGKYVPGGVWLVLAQAELSKEYGVPRTRSASTALVHMLVSLVVGVVVAAVALGLSSVSALRSYWWLTLIGLAGALLLVPPVFNWLLRLCFRLIRRPRPEPVVGRYLAIACFWVLVTWLALGTHMWLLAVTVAPSASGLWLLSTGGFALAWAVGFIVVVLPAGAGAREAALVLALSPVMSGADALALALVSRVLMLLGDFAMAGVAVLAERRRHRRGSLRPRADELPEHG